MIELSLPETAEDDIQVQLARIFSVAGCRTQVELAEVLGIRQSSIADAKRRGRIPPGWLLTLLRLRGVHPDWIIRGARPKFLISNIASDEAYPASDPAAAQSALIRKILRCFSLRDLTGELTRRQAAAEARQK